jgi:hypothetical protein
VITLAMPDETGHAMVYIYRPSAAEVEGGDVITIVDTYAA